MSPYVGLPSATQRILQGGNVIFCRIIGVSVRVNGNTLAVLVKEKPWTGLSAEERLSEKCEELNKKPNNAFLWELQYGCRKCGDVNIRPMDKVDR